MYELLMNIKKKAEPKVFSTIRLVFKTLSVVGLPTPGAPSTGTNFGPHVHVVHTAFFNEHNQLVVPSGLVASASSQFNANTPANGIDGLNTTHWVSDRVENAGSWGRGDIWFQVQAPIIEAKKVRIYQTSYVSRDIEVWLDGELYKTLGPVPLPILAEQNDPVFKDIGYIDIVL